uniref:Uncharacterized protein n=1 Tax=Arundo donax TaxID=35708 RepID=A0A0A8XP59_ARUDO
MAYKEFAHLKTSCHETIIKLAIHCRYFILFFYFSMDNLYHQWLKEMGTNSIFRKLSN